MHPLYIYRLLWNSWLFAHSVKQPTACWSMPISECFSPTIYLCQCLKLENTVSTSMVGEEQVIAILCLTSGTHLSIPVIYFSDFIHVFTWCWLYMLSWSSVCRLPFGLYFWLANQTPKLTFTRRWRPLTLGETC